MQTSQKIVVGVAASAIALVAAKKVRTRTQIWRVNHASKKHAKTMRKQGVVWQDAAA